MYKGVGKVPLLMLSEKDDSNERELYSLSKRKILSRMAVPEAKGKKCIDAGFGWILALSEDDGRRGCEVSLFNPFCSAAKIELPNTRTFPWYEENNSFPKVHFIQQAVLSANPSLTSNFMVFVAVEFSMGFWRYGDKSWTSLGISYGSFVCGDMFYYKEKMYTIDIYGFISTWDPCGTDPAKTELILQCDTPFIENLVRMPYLVESSDGELLVILRNNVDYSPYIVTGVTHFGVMRVDLVKMEYKEINGLGKDAVFLGHNASVSIPAADYPGVLKPNCIYFTDDCWICHADCEKGGGKDMGIYNLEDGSIERFDVESFSRICPPLWIFPSF